MTLRPGLPRSIYKQLFLFRESTDSFFDKLQVVTDSTAIVYSIRILIVMLALLMGYIHTPKEERDYSPADKTEIVEKDIPKSILNQIK